MTDKKVKIFRTFQNQKQTLGLLSVTDPLKGPLFVCRTLELPNRDNLNNISCILAGKYICRFTKSPGFSKAKGEDVYTYEITHVPGRAGVRIHAANFTDQIRGCIALGNAHKDINADGELDVIHSGNTMKEFEQLMEKDDFELEIIEAF